MPTHWLGEAKDPDLATFLVSMLLPGFRSRWITQLRCARSSPSQSQWRISKTRAKGADHAPSAAPRFSLKALKPG